MGAAREAESFKCHRADATCKMMKTDVQSAPEHVLSRAQMHLHRGVAAAIKWMLVLISKQFILAVQSGGQRPGREKREERRCFRMIDEYQLDFTQLNPFASIVIFAGFI
jgi:hypothetical protein